MSHLTIAFIVSGLIAVVFLAFSLFVSRKGRAGVARNPGVFKTGNPPLTGGRRRKHKPSGGDLAEATR